MSGTVENCNKEMVQLHEEIDYLRNKHETVLKLVKDKTRTTEE
jgi:hypothetical protein